jgi:flagellar basal-body rod protein FlgG
MMNGIFSTLSGKIANETKLDIIANNLANALTAGFKASRPAFDSDLIEGGPEPDQLPSAYVNIPDSYIHFSDAPITQTSNNLDLAIEGSGFFAVSTPQGIMYTRNGQFTLDSDKKLVTQDGNPVQGVNGGDITVEGNQNGKDIKIDRDGSVYVDKIFVDKVKVVDFADKKPLKYSGTSLFSNTDINNTEVPPQNFSVVQGAYETSNVNVMKEMVDMMSAMRAYESYTQIDQNMADMLDKLIDLGKF